MFVVGVTSCSFGVAHTYMAAEAIEKACKERGYDVKVETQGLLGIENELTQEEIDRADYIVFANDVELTAAYRFENVQDKIHQFGPHQVIKDPNCIFED